MRAAAITLGICAVLALVAFALYNPVRKAKKADAKDSQYKQTQVNRAEALRNLLQGINDNRDRLSLSAEIVEFLRIEFKEQRFTRPYDPADPWMVSARIAHYEPVLRDVRRLYDMELTDMPNDLRQRIDEYFVTYTTPES
ncbi:MAG TPA: hypothetical protein VD735_00910 [Candidatus Saccharimonadales bacterium]|nr:hypothetical protein [Candidatus Saccharimonadales bacterium]